MRRVAAAQLNADVACERFATTVIPIILIPVMQLSSSQPPAASLYRGCFSLLHHVCRSKFATRGLSSATVMSRTAASTR